MSTQNPDQQRMSSRSSNRTENSGSYELSNEATRNGDSSTAGKKGVGFAGGGARLLSDYLPSGFIWRDPKPPFKGRSSKPTDMNTNSWSY
jgi:hypothetical protein